ncbi:hypothetical protein [Persicimonas caeni]|uniref:hypothetical protein n=1 Tax=Persicimonas caeni TaxID=2292766 RepID=UPI00143D834F|nr:hypothetical protein [Persicimonas caeni]
MQEFSKEANTFFDAHLADDPVTQRMLARLALVANELDAAGLDAAVGAAKFVRALDLTDAKQAADLPIALDETLCEIIDGSQSSPAKEEHCTSPTTRQAAAVVNTVGRVARDGKTYAWADEELRESPLKTYAQVSLSVIDDALARVPLALDDELRVLPRLDLQHDPDTGDDHQVVSVATLALFWAEDGQVYCGMSDNHRQRWTEVVEFARRHDYPVHQGFRGERLSDAQLAEIFEEIEARYA